MTAARKRRQVARTPSCIYCRVRPADTRDHVPPESLFPRPRPSDLITVPCCRACNASFGQDDEYFRDVTTLRADVADHPAASQILPIVQRSFARPRGRAKLAALLATVTEVNLKSPAGLFLGRGATYEIDFGRVDRFLTRTVRGLFYHEQRQPLPSDTRISVALGFAEKTALQESVAPMIAGRPVVTKGAGVFRYVWNHVEGDTTATAWVLEFFDRVAFAAITLSEQKLRAWDVTLD